MTKAGLPVSTPSAVEGGDKGNDDEMPEYRDRAKERRAAFGGSKKISLPMKKSGTRGGGDSPTAPKQSAAGQADHDAASQPGSAAPSKGAALLGKMGWTSGEGLGAQGTGRTAPVATEMYVAGVGLGAAGGKVGDAGEEAARNTRGDYGEFLERTREKAKERFERMGQGG